MSERQRQRAAPTATASQTQTQTQASQGGSRNEPPRVLRLRGSHASTGRSVQWADDVVDNEGLGRKSSKVCCIYHKPKGVDESSDESSSDSSDSDSDAEPASRRVDGGKVPACGHSHHDRGRKGNKSHKQKRPPSPNAYEKVPKQKPKDSSGSRA